MARRVRWLFILCALLPVGALAVVSYSLVAKQLNDQGRASLRQAGKNTAMATYSRLGLLEESLRAVAVASRTEGAISNDRFRTLVIQREDGTLSSLKGKVLRVPDLTPLQEEHLEVGRTLLSLPHAGSGQTLLLGVLLDPADRARGTVWAEPDPSYLWYGSPVGADAKESTLPPGMELCVFGTSPSPLHCSGAIDWNLLSQRLDDQLGSPLTSAAAAQFEWSDQNEDYLAGYWSLPLSFQYAMPAWTFTVSQPRASVLRPLAHLRQVFPATVLLALLIVVLLSNVQIRRSLEPLALLMAGIARVADQDFGGQVIVESGDEFEDLADSFNNMTGRLESSFRALAAINEIGRSVQQLTLDSDGIIETVLNRALELFGCDSAGVTAVRETSARTTHVLSVAGPARHSYEHLLPADEVEELRTNRQHLRLSGIQGERSYLRCEAFSERRIDSFLVFPLFAKHELSGLMALGYVDPTSSATEDTVYARQLADQVAVALSNARLLKDLNELNIGTLTALARTIDAKSPWTAGHSERVTEHALRIGRHMSLDDEALSRLHRGGLLHDIGKIGIPGSILDKPGKLTAEEMQAIRQHPQIGARILSPIAAYADAIPIVRHHHEKFDGSGYPDGLSGEGIPFLARVLAVGDVYDSCRLDRPYRAGMGHQEAQEIIRRGAGSHFDPAIVAAFLEIVAEQQEGIDSETSPGAKPTGIRRHA